MWASFAVAKPCFGRALHLTQSFPTSRRRFPSGEASYSAYIELCDADVLAEGMIHCATTPACANQAFNVR